ncbi:hypothetical protein P3L10_013839 [Capsicum annuum]
MCGDDVMCVLVFGGRGCYGGCKAENEFGNVNIEGEKAMQSAKEKADSLSDWASVKLSQ